MPCLSVCLSHTHIHTRAHAQRDRDRQTQRETETEKDRQTETQAFHKSTINFKKSTSKSVQFTLLKCLTQ